MILNAPKLAVTENLQNWGPLPEIRPDVWVSGSRLRAGLILHCPDKNTPAITQLLQWRGVELWGPDISAQHAGSEVGEKTGLIQMHFFFLILKIMHQYKKHNYFTHGNSHILAHLLKTFLWVSFANVENISPFSIQIQLRPMKIQKAIQTSNLVPDSLWRGPEHCGGWIAFNEEFNRSKQTVGKSAWPTLA